MSNKHLFVNIDDSTLQRIKELQRVSINPQLMEQVRAISSQMETFRNSINYNTRLQNQIAQLSRSLQAVQSLPIESIQISLKEMYRPLLEIKPLVPQITLAMRSFAESIQPLRIKLSENNRFLEQIRQATNFSYAETMSQAIKSYSDLLAQNQPFVSQIRESINTYNNFAQNTLIALSKVSNSQTSLALKSSLLLANEQTLRSANLIEPVFSEIRQEDRNTSVTRTISNRFQIQRNELLRREDLGEEEDYESIVIKSPASISFDLIVNCLKIVGLCNETSQTARGSSIFTLTNSAWAYSFKLLQTVPTNQERLAEIVDYLYFILIEGAGKDFLRFIDYEDGKHSGFFLRNDPAVEVVWKIKHLRNKWLRHDIEHGKDADIKKSYQLRKDALEWFGMQKVPQSRDEFIFLYNNLMLKVEDFLKVLLDRVSKF